MVSKLKLAVIASFAIAIAAPATAFDFGKMISNQVEKAVEKAVEKTVSDTIDKAISTIMPKRDIKPQTGSSEPVAPEKDLSQGVIIFGYDGCPYCIKAYAYLNGNDVTYELMDIEKSDDAYLISKANNISGVPVMFVNGQRVSGFTDSSYKKALQQHGYM